MSLYLFWPAIDRAIWQLKQKLHVVYMSSRTFSKLIFVIWQISIISQACLARLSLLNCSIAIWHAFLSILIVLSRFKLKYKTFSTNLSISYKSQPKTCFVFFHYRFLPAPFFSYPRAICVWPEYVRI